MKPRNPGIVAIVGPMFSGKTSHLLLEMEKMRVVYGKDKIMLINYEKDTRYSDKAEIAAHNGLKSRSLMLSGSLCDRLEENEEFKRMIDDVYVIGINEGQFFPDIDQFSLSMALKKKRVVVAGLDLDYNIQPFFNMQRLMSVSNVIKKTAICSVCSEDKAMFSCLKINDTLKDDDGFLIGGEDVYESRCLYCLENYKKGNAYNAIYVNEI